MKDFTVQSDDDGIRLDRWFRRHHPGIPQGLIQKLCRKGVVRLDGKRAKPADRVASGQVVRVPEVKEAEKRPTPTGAPKGSKEQADLQLRPNILYQNEHIIVLNKPPGLPTQGGSKVKVSVDSLLPYLVSRGAPKPKLVHRIDKFTTGILVAACSAKAADILAQAFRTRDVEKKYLALVKGVPHPLEGTINAPLLAVGTQSVPERMVVHEEGKPATTHYKVLDQAGRVASLLEVTIETGRKHQIRAHMEYIECPIIGDRKYAPSEEEAVLEGIAPLMHLHAASIRLPSSLPVAKHYFEAPLPEHFRESLAFLGLEA